MRQHELYILQAMHMPGDSLLERAIIAGTKDWVERKKEVQRQQKIMRRILRDTILHESITQVYGDMVDEKYATQLNRMIRSSEQKLRGKIAKESDLEEKAQFAHIPEERREDLRLYMTLTSCRLNDVPVDVYRTEMSFPRDGLIVAIVVVDAIISAGLGIQQITTRVRDYFTYRNIKKTAGPTNILWMGPDHTLVDFYKPNSGFAVTAVTITDQGPQYRFANRDGVPDFFREIVERRYAEMKEQTSNL